MTSRDTRAARAAAVVCAAVCASTTSLSGRAVAADAEKPPAKPWLHAPPDVLNAWQDDRFGMFVCWGPVTLTGQEIGWSRGKARPNQKEGGRGPTPASVYDALYKKWKPDRFDARAWVRTAKEAGCRYVIFLVKHHDGYCLYDTKLTDYKSTSPEAAWQHDAMKDVAEACREGGLKLFLYYSQPDWHHPDYRTENHRRYVEFLHGQVRELLTGYGRIDGLWFDGLGGTAEDWDAEALFRLARSLQPHLIINNRCGLPGDFDTPEQRLGRFQLDRPWETCMTLGTQWSWKPDDRIKSLKECIDALVTCAGRGGNLALNTNPMPDGRIEPRQAERFREIGAWLARYGQSVYGTRGGPFRSAPWGVTTHRGDTVYVHVLKWPGERITLPPIDKKVLSATLLCGGAAAVRQTDRGIEITVPPEDRRELDTIVILRLDGPASDLRAGLARSGSLAFGQRATASNVFQKSPEFAPQKAVDDDPETRWGCDWGTRSAWLEIDLGQPRVIGRAWISEPYGRVRRFALEAKQPDGQWKAFHTGAAIGKDLAVDFAPVTARHVRLNLIETTEGPSIWEFQLFPPEGPAVHK